MQMLADKVCVITGASGRVGEAVAHRFVAEGAHLLLVGRDAARLQASAQRLKLAPKQRAVCLPLDVTAADAGELLTQAIEQHFGRWDGLLCAAGAFAYVDLLKVTPVQWHQTLSVNLTAPFMLTQAMLAFLGRRGQGRGGWVINIGSIHGAVGDALAVPQCAAKFGLVGLTKACAEAGRQAGLRVNAISPGAIALGSADRLSTFGAEAQTTQGDVAALAVFLGSDGAQSISGAVIEAFGQTRPVIATAPVAPQRRPP